MRRLGVALVVLAVLGACAAGWVCGYASHSLVGARGRSIAVYDTAWRFKLWLSLPPGTVCDEPSPWGRDRWRDTLCRVPVSAHDFTGCVPRAVRP